jgi:toxin ParE1/3/4
LTPTVLITPQAEFDLWEIGVFIAQDNLRAAEKVLFTIDRKCRLLAVRPGLGRLRLELAVGLRSFPVVSYVVFYRVISGGVEVIRVLHGSRDVEALFKRG